MTGLAPHASTSRPAGQHTPADLVRRALRAGAPRPADVAASVAFDVARGLTAAGVLLSATVHLEGWASGYKDLHIIGPLFLLNAIGGFVLGVAVVVWRHWLPALLAVGFGALTLAAFWTSVEVGLFGFQDVATGTPQVLAEVAEIVAMVFGVATIGICLLSQRRSRRR